MTAPTINDPEVQKFLAEANRETVESSAPEVAEPLDPVFDLVGGYRQDDGTWATKFTVRELTGRDEEALARITDPGRLMIALLQRGLVRVGSQPADDEVLDGLFAGDWETVLIAIRIITFGPEFTTEWACGSCGNPYEVTFDLRKDLPIRSANENPEAEIPVQGRRNSYIVTALRGSGQRKILEQISKKDTTTADLNTLTLFECIASVNGYPLMSMDAVRDLSIADRRLLLDTVNDNRLGPNLRGVKTKCPTCGVEQASPLSVAALFPR